MSAFNFAKFSELREFTLVMALALSIVVKALVLGSLVLLPKRWVIE
ncbi:MAG: hypothetical protein RMX63_07930 [Aulosira sp. ZfuCHP01]|nr:hypothetical protein [Aulosira sp. ZfuCHP01]